MDILSQTYVDLRDLRAQGRDHIWGFVARNLVRPVWLSSDDQRADLVIGNPPWLSYRFMSRASQGASAESLSSWESGKAAGLPRTRTSRPTSSRAAASCT